MRNQLSQICNPALDNCLQPVNGEDFFESLLPRLIILGLIVGAVVFTFVLLIGAIQWITSGGDKAAIEAARGKVISGLVGIVILFSLFAILALVGDFFGINLTIFDLSVLRVGSIPSGGSGGSGGPGVAN
jgi:hypothetical protein